MNRRHFFKFLGIGATALSVNPVKFLNSAPLVEDVSIKATYTRGNFLDASIMVAEYKPYFTGELGNLYKDKLVKEIAMAEENILINRYINGAT